MLSIRVTHLPLEAAIFLWHVASIFLLLTACWQLSGLLFPGRRSARWCGVCLVAALFTIPVAGTALYLMDQYLNPRNLAAFAGIFAVTRMLEKKYLAGVFVAGVCGLRASADVGVSIFILCSVSGDADGFERAKKHLLLECACSVLAGDSAGASFFSGVSRSGKTA